MEELPPTPNLVNAPPRPPALPFIGVALLAFVLGLGAGYFIWARPLQTELASISAEKTAQVEESIPDEITRYDIPEDDDPVLGSANAPITIIEFSDYECPYCRKWHQEVWPKIQAKYGDKIRLVYRDFPLDNIHPNATPAAVAANCAGEQDRYWEFSEMLYNNAQGLSADVYLAYATELKLNLDDFNQCLADDAQQKEVQADLNYASEFGVRSTPTFFINGMGIVGAQPFEVFEQIIDLELAGKLPK